MGGLLVACGVVIVQGGHSNSIVGLSSGNILDKDGNRLLGCIFHFR